MSIRKILMATAAVAILTPLFAPTSSFAEGRGGIAGNVAAGVAASPRGMANAAGGGGAPRGVGGGWNRGGGVAMGNGGGWNRGGAAMGNGGGWNRGGVAMGNGGGGWNRGGGGGGWNHGGGRGWGAGLAAGALVGGAIASNAYYGGPYYNNGDYGYYDQPDYYDQGATVAVAPDDGDSAGYCAQRYRSYDPGSGTYLGYDGMRHPCP